MRSSDRGYHTLVEQVGATTCIEEDAGHLIDPKMQDADDAGGFFGVQGGFAALEMANVRGCERYAVWQMRSTSLAFIVPLEGKL